MLYYTTCTVHNTIRYNMIYDDTMCCVMCLHWRRVLTSSSLSWCCYVGDEESHTVAEDRLQHCCNTSQNEPQL